MAYMPQGLGGIGQQRQQRVGDSGRTQVWQLLPSTGWPTWAGEASRPMEEAVLGTLNAKAWEEAGRPQLA